MARGPFILSVLIVAFILTPGASAFLIETTGDNAMFVCMTYPDGDYTIGSEIPVTVHVFDRGEYANVDEVELTIGQRTGDPRTTPLTETSTGLWTGSFTVQVDDMVPTTDEVGLVAKATEGEEVSERDLYIDMVDIPDITIYTHIDGGSDRVGPGDRRTFTWEVWFDGHLVDAEVELAIWRLTVSPDPVLERVSEGIYRYEFVMPDEKESTVMTFYFEATYVSSEGIEAFDEEYPVLIYSPLNIWGHRIGPVTEASTKFDLHITNMEGEPAAGAHVDLDYSYKDADGKVERELNGTTDDEGIARVVFDHEGVSQYDNEVSIGGVIEWQGYEQDTMFMFPVRPTQERMPRPDPGLFTVTRTGPALEWDQDYHYNATVTLDEEPLPNAEVHGYFITDHQVLDHVNATTDAEGGMSTNLHVPSGGPGDYLDIETIFKTPSPPGRSDPYQVYKYRMVKDERDRPYDSSQSILERLDVFRSDELTLKVGPMGSDRTMSVVAKHPGVDHHWDAWVIVGNDDDHVDTGLVSDWTYWSNYNTWDRSTYSAAGYYYQQCSYEDGSFVTTLRIPDNLPDDGYFIWVLMAEQTAEDYSTPLVTRELMKTGVFEAEVSDDPKTQSWWDPTGLWLVLAVVLLLVVVVLVALTVSRRGGRESTDDGGQHPGPTDPSEPVGQHELVHPGPDNPPDPHKETGQVEASALHDDDGPEGTATSGGAADTQTIRCQKCNTTMTIPTTRPIQVTCTNCGASGVIR